MLSSSETLMEATFRIDGDIAVAAPHAAGPWDPTMQHGAAPSALITWAAERIETPTPMHVARVTVDLLRPVPVAPLAVRTSVVRQGRKIQLCAVSLLAGDTEVARGSVLKIRSADLPPPDDLGHAPLTLPGPEAGQAPRDWIGDRTANAFATGLSISVARGGFRQPGPAAIWFRMDRPLVEGRETSAAMRAVMTGDFCNGVSSVLDFQAWTFLNGDLTVSLARPPVGEWILLDAETWIGPAGSGLAFARLADRHGYFGRAIQSLVIERR